MRLLLILTTLFINGCGVADMMAPECKGELKGACVFVFGNHGDRDEDIDNLEDRVEIIEGQLEELELSYESLLNEILFLQSQNQLTNAALNNVQTITNNLVVEMAELKLDIKLEEIIDPCGDYPGHHDEVILKMTSGEYLAYFEVGGSRFLSILEKGVNYRTTDKQKCIFRINASNNELEEL